MVKIIEAIDELLEQFQLPLIKGELSRRLCLEPRVE